MDYQEKLKDWILNCSPVLDIKVERMEWIKDWFPEYNDFAVKTYCNGSLVVGRGIDKDKDVALVKAFSELIERIACKHYGIRSNGVAAHYNRENAIENARKELIERDAILSHFLTNEPFYTSKLFPWMNKFQKKVLDRGLSILFGEAYSAVRDYHVVFCKILGNDKFGAFWGYGVDRNLSDAYQHSVFECMVNVSAFLYGAYNVDKIDLLDFKNLNIINGIDHQRLHFSEDLLPSIKTNMSPKNDKNFLELDQIEVKHINIEHISNFSSTPLFVYRACSKQLQNIFYGLGHKDKMNFNRLETFKGKSLTLNDISLIPHPIG